MERGRTGARVALLTVAAWACIAAPAMMLAGTHSPLRVAAALALFCLAPGAALLPLLAPRDAAIELALVVGASLAITAACAQVMLWLDAWSPTTGACVLAGVCLVPLVAQLLPRRAEAA